MRKIQISYKQRYLKYIVLLLLFYPLNILGAQGVISVKGQAMTIKQAIQLIEKTVITHFLQCCRLEKHNQQKSKL